MMDEVKRYECTVLIDASASANVYASSADEAAELAENEVAERGSGSLCHQCSDHTECGDAYAVLVYLDGVEVLDTDRRSVEIKALQQRLTAAEQRNANQAESIKGYQDRNAELVELLQECVNVVRFGEDFDLPVTTMSRIDAALKPTEQVSIDEQ